MTVAYLLAFFNIYKDLSEKHELNSLCLEGTLVPHLKKVFFTHLVCKGGARDSARSSEHDLRLGGSQLIFQFSSVTQSCLTLCDPTNHSTPGFPVHHQLLEFTQTHVHQVGDAIQPSHPLSSPPPPAPNPSQHEGLFQ